MWKLGQFDHIFCPFVTPQRKKTPQNTDCILVKEKTDSDQSGWLGMFHMFRMRPTGVQYMCPQLLKVQETRNVLSNVSDLFFYQSLFLYKVHVHADVALKRSQLCCFVLCCFFFLRCDMNIIADEDAVYVELQMCFFCSCVLSYSCCPGFTVVAVKRLFHWCARFKTVTLNDDLIVCK